MTKSAKHVQEEVDGRQATLARERDLRTSAERDMLDEELREVLSRWVNAIATQDGINKAAADLFVVAKRWLA